MALISMIAVAFGTLLSVDPKRISRIIDYMRTAILPIFGLVFLLDYLTAPGVAVPMLYAMPVLMTSICVGLEWSLASAVLATVLTYIGFVLSPLGGNIEDGTVNRLIAAVLIWACVVFGWLLGYVRKEIQTFYDQQK